LQDTAIFISFSPEIFEDYSAIVVENEIFFNYFNFWLWNDWVTWPLISKVSHWRAGSPSEIRNSGSKTTDGDSKIQNLDLETTVLSASRAADINSQVKKCPSSKSGH